MLCAGEATVVFVTHQYIYLGFINELTKLSSPNSLANTLPDNVFGCNYFSKRNYLGSLLITFLFLICSTENGVRWWGVRRKLKRQSEKGVFTDAFHLSSRSLSWIVAVAIGMDIKSFTVENVTVDQNCKLYHSLQRNLSE